MLCICGSYESTYEPGEPIHVDFADLQRSADNWSDKSTFACRTCIFFVPKVGEGHAQGKVGRCRRRAPVCHEGWPAVFETDWCGDHKLMA